jgi:hypothetical protein
MPLQAFSLYQNQNFQSRKQLFVPKILLMLLLTLILACSALLGSAKAASVTPTIVSGNPTCVGLGYAAGFKVDPPNSGTYNIDASHTVTVTSNGTFFDWSSTLGIDAVIAKGGQNGAKVYAYYPPSESFGDTQLVSPNNDNGNPAGLSHIEFCYDYELGVSKTATTSFARDFDWTIAKSVDQANLTLSTGQQQTVNYTVTVVKDAGTDSGWSVSGTVTVNNPHPTQAASGVTVTDTISGIGAVTVSCPSTTIAAATSMVCTYGPVALPNGDSRTNTASATTSTAGISGGSGTAAVTFAAPTTIADNCVVVSDTIKGVLSSNLCAGEVFNYPIVINANDLVCGANTINNIASLISDDNVTETANATVNVDVACVHGCTLTQGYWKTHSRQGPAPYDDAWANLGVLQENTVFFSSGKTWYQVFSTAPAGNPYYQLAHQYMAAKLNVLNGATPTAAVSSALASTESLLTGLNPTSSFSKAQKANMVALAGTLGSFNQGLTGPGHCSE